MEDYGGTAAPEIALAIRRESDDRVTIRVYDASSGARLLNSKTKDIHRPVSLFTANHKNGNGKETILLARLRDADPRVLVIERNASTGKKVGSYVIR